MPSGSQSVNFAIAACMDGERNYHFGGRLLNIGCRIETAEVAK